MTADNHSISDLGLTVDHARDVVARNGAVVHLGGNVRLWQILGELCKRYDRYYPSEDLLVAVWEDYLPSLGTFWRAVYDLRRRLEPLGLTIKFVKGLGYRLDEDQKPRGSSAGARRQGRGDAKPGSGHPRHLQGKRPVGAKGDQRQ
jgi:DNA-binding response OmpR family regulator